jgi:hypothetical protein
MVNNSRRPGIISMSSAYLAAASSVEPMTNTMRLCSDNVARNRNRE